MDCDQSYLSHEKVIKLMGKYSVPCIISLLVGALYNIVDQIFIVNASYLVHTATPQIRLFSRLPLLHLGLRL